MKTRKISINGPINSYEAIKLIWAVEKPKLKSKLLKNCVHRQAILHSARITDSRR
jgi:hypothetical protein